jgi:hypothetical protein
MSLYYLRRVSVGNKKCLSGFFLNPLKHLQGDRKGTIVGTHLLPLQFFSLALKTLFW